MQTRGGGGGGGYDLHARVKKPGGKKQGRGRLCPYGQLISRGVSCLCALTTRHAMKVYWGMDV
jgi:hypothetical protein